MSTGHYQCLYQYEGGGGSLWTIGGGDIHLGTVMAPHLGNRLHLRTLTLTVESDNMGYSEYQGFDGMVPDAIQELEKKSDEWHFDDSSSNLRINKIND